VKREAVQQVTQYVAAEYQEKTGVHPEIYVSAAAAGVSLVI